MCSGEILQRETVKTIFEESQGTKSPLILDKLFKLDEGRRNMLPATDQC